MKVSIVLIAYNLTKKVELCLESVLNQDFSDYEVIVVDDGSTDDTAKRIKKYPVNLISQTNQGIAAARNAGAEVSRGDIIIFLDGDCIVQKDFIENMIKPLENPEIGMTQGYIDIANPESLIASLNFIKAKYIFQDLEYLDFAWGACLAIRRGLFERIGRFISSLKYVEDQEIADRILREGYKIYLSKKARYFHPFQESLWKHLKRHAGTARWMVRLIITSTKRFTSQHGTKREYFKLLIHGLLLLSLLVIPWNWKIFIILLIICVLTHLPLAFKAMKEDLKYMLIIPFEFLTRISWVVGAVFGLIDILLGRNVEKIKARSKI